MAQVCFYVSASAVVAMIRCPLDGCPACLLGGSVRSTAEHKPTAPCCACCARCQAAGRLPRAAHGAAQRHLAADHRAGGLVHGLGRAGRLGVGHGVSRNATWQQIIAWVGASVDLACVRAYGRHAHADVVAVPACLIALPAAPSRLTPTPPPTHPHHPHHKSVPAITTTTHISTRPAPPPPSYPVAGAS